MVLGFEVASSCGCSHMNSAADMLSVGQANQPFSGSHILPASQPGYVITVMSETRGSNRAQKPCQISLLVKVVIVPLDKLNCTTLPSISVGRHTSQGCVFQRGHSPIDSYHEDILSLISIKITQQIGLWNLVWSVLSKQGIQLQPGLLIFKNYARRSLSRGIV